MRLWKLLFLLAFCMYLAVVVYAHPGGTDSDGGHTNHDTGEYHWHHGYQAHQHKDLDGDGDLDCPYLFDNKTESSRNETEKTEENRTKKVWNYFLPIIGCFALYGVIWLVDKIRWKLKK